MSGASDLILHLVPCPLEVILLDRAFTIPAMDAVDWLRILTIPGLSAYDVFPVLAGPDAVEFVEDVLWDELATDGEITRLGFDVISAAADRPWWVAVRIVASVAEAWDRVHVNQAAGASFAGWLDEVWSRIMSLMDPKRVVGWVGSVEAPPEGWEAEVDFDAQERAFMAAMRSAM